jgi:hypothetical protein
MNWLHDAVALVKKYPERAVSGLLVLAGYALLRLVY